MSYDFLPSPFRRWSGTLLNFYHSSKCGMTFSRIVDLDGDTTPRVRGGRLPLRPRQRPRTTQNRRALPNDDCEDITVFRRVRISITRTQRIRCLDCDMSFPRAQDFAPHMLKQYVVSWLFGFRIFADDHPSMTDKIDDISRWAFAHPFSAAHASRAQYRASSKDRGRGRARSPTL